MRVRHKPPTLVSMWMLDVFCCALGCVTLLFLLNSRVATEAEAASDQKLAAADKKLTDAFSALDATRGKLAAEVQARDKLAANVTELEGIRLELTDQSRRLEADLKLALAEKDDTAKKLAAARAEAKAAKALLDATQTALTAAEKKADATAMELADATALLKKREKDIDALAKKQDDSAAQVDSLQKLMRLKDDERALMETRVAALRKELIDIEAKLRATQKELDANLAAARNAAKNAGEELANAKTAAKTATEEATAAKAQIKDLTKKIDDANTTIIDLQGDKAKLADKFNKVQKETESRFAGIAMTGKKVVFLVDMSGSMGKRDLNNVDATKWPMAVETVCKVMRSIPTLEQYQVITFSSSATWLFGAGQWQDYSGEKSVEAVRDALLKVKPQDDTNMHAGLEKAFALRPRGLDTIYLFSDGLPTSGPNLTAAQQALAESERGVILGKQMRETLVNDWNRAEVGRTRVKINSVGFYFESPDVGAFLWSLSRENEGSFVGMSRP